MDHRTDHQHGGRIPPMSESRSVKTGRRRRRRRIHWLLFILGCAVVFGATIGTTDNSPIAGSWIETTALVLGAVLASAGAALLLAVRQKRSL